MIKVAIVDDNQINRITIQRKVSALSRRTFSIRSH